MKDNFSGHASDYARYRPTYPDALFTFIYERLSHFGAAWDCGTGNGQVAVKLAERFDHVYATDLSANQLAQAPQRPNITYRMQRAEDASFDSQPFDLITVAQAIHWFDFKAFYATVNRVLKPDGLLAVWGYTLLTVNDAVDAIVRHLHSGTLDTYWDPERTYVDARYQTIPFPFAECRPAECRPAECRPAECRPAECRPEEIAAPEFTQSISWMFTDLIGYLNTWSAVKHYQQREGQNPVSRIEADLQRAWGKAEQQTVRVPVFLRLGKKPS